MTTLANVAAHLKRAGAKTARARRELPSLWLMTDAVRLPDPMPVIRRLPRGCGVIVRHTDPAARRRIATAVATLCRRRGLICLIAGDWRLAAATRAHGLHLGEQAATLGRCAPAYLWRRLTHRILTISAHGQSAVLRGARRRPDALVLASVFRTPSHPAGPSLGLLRLATLTRSVKLPVIALGGIIPANARRLLGSGAAGIAAIGGLAMAD